MPDNTSNQQNQVTPEQALAVVTSLVRATKLTFDEHVYVETCIRVLTEAIQPPAKVDKLNKPPRPSVVEDN